MMGGKRGSKKGGEETVKILQIIISTGGGRRNLYVIGKGGVSCKGGVVFSYFLKGTH